MIGSAKFISLGFLAVGVFVLMQVFLPILSFQLWEIGQNYGNSRLITPHTSNNTQILGVSIEQKDNFSTFISSIKRETKPNYDQFQLSVPKLNISQTIVGVDSNDLSKYLAHLPGSALPGEKGNVFISGHSALSQFFSMKKAVFANLPSLKKGDQIEVLAAGAKFSYFVLELKIVDPKDLSVINPPDSSGRYLTLMTCVPPGLNTKRLTVLAKMI